MRNPLLERTLSFVLFLFSFCLAAQDPYRPGIIHLKLKEDYASQVKLSSNNKIGISKIDLLGEQVGITSIKRIYREAGIFEKAHQQFGLHLWYEIKFDESKSMADVIRQYSALGHFQFVEPCLKYELVKPLQNSKGTPPKINSVLTDPTNDPLFFQQWHYSNTGQTGGTPGADIALPQAWGTQAGATNVIVAVIDGGIDISHPDLAGAVWINADEIAGNNIDDDHNGYVDDVNGYGFGDNTGTIYPHFHGTHVSGTIGAITNNSIGVSGIAGGSGTANGVRLMSCAGFGQFGTGGFENAMVYAADNGAVISQNSWGGGSHAIEAGIDYFVARAGYDNSAANFNRNIQIGPMAGGLVVFAAGNSSTDDPNIGYPASYPPVVAVASTDHRDVRSYFSNYGSWVDIAAPGSEVFSTYPVSMGSYEHLSGTSMACPHVSGVSALIISQFGGPSFFPDLVRDRLQETADDISQLNPGYEDLLGSGRVNAFQSLQVADEIPPADITDLSIVEEKLTAISIKWTATGASGVEGSASAYEVRYSTSPITGGNFSAATLVTGVPRPKVSGTEEQLEVKNLTHSTQYYFAMRSRDFFGNWSGLSNVVSATTLLPPIIHVSPLSLTENLFTGGTSTQNLTVSNTGASDLDIRVSTSSSNISVSSISGNSVSKKTGSGFNITNGKEILLKHQPTASLRGKSGIEYQNKLATQSQPSQQQVNKRYNQSGGVPTPLSTGKLFTLNVYGGSITELDPETGTLINSFPVPESYYGGPEGLAFDGEYLYFVSGFGTNNIYRLNPETGDVISTLVTELPAIDALGHSGTFLYAMDYANDVIREIDFDSGVINRTITPGHDIGAGLSFGGSRGTLFATNFSGQILEIDLESETIINSFSTRGVDYGLGYSEGLGLLLCANVNLGSIDAYNPDSGELEFSYTIPVSSAIASDESGSIWLNAGITEYTIAAGQETIIPINFDAKGLNGGTYDGEVSVKSNDPVTPVVTIPVTLNVTGAPNLSVRVDPIDFGVRYATGVYDTTLLITNTGTDVLNISSISITNPVFHVDGASSFSLQPKQAVEVHIVFAPVTPSAFGGVLTIYSNDPDEAEIGIQLIGRAVDPPVIGVDPDSFDVTLYTGETLSEELHIANTGEAGLHFNINIESDPEPGSISPSYVPIRKEIITVNNQGEKINGFAFENIHPLEVGDFTLKASSPEPLTCFTSDPSTGFIYGQANFGNNFYRYSPTENNWTTLTTCPLYSGNNGGAAYLNGKIYTSYTGTSSQLGVYDISSNTWTTISLGTGIATGNIESDGIKIYLVSDYSLVSYNPSTGGTTSLASPPFSFYPWGGLSYFEGNLYAHQGNGTVGFAKYNIALNTWTNLPFLPGGAVLGSAIDPYGKVYYAYGTYSGNSLYSFSLETQTWTVTPIPLFYVNDGGIAFVPNTQLRGIYFAQGESGYGLARFETSLASNWLTVDPTVGTVAQNNNQTLSVTFDATELFGGTYQGTIAVGSNDPVSPLIEIPVSMLVIGAPNISINKTTVEFGDTFVGYESQDSILIENTGTDNLIITSMATSLPFNSLVSTFVLPPKQSRAVIISFHPTSVGTFSQMLTISSNDPGEPALIVQLTGNSVSPPVGGVTPTSLSASLFTGQQQVKTITINNTGGSALNWNLTIENSGSNLLSDILSSLNERYDDVTSIIPNRYDFYDGETGNWIADGGGDMYDGGNILGTNLGGYINYTQGSINSHSYLGSGGSYFTMKYPGLFVMAADMNVSYFEIFGDLGADGGGSFDATIIQTTQGGKTYNGFVKRVYNAGDPSVNHLIIVDANSSSGHTYGSNTNDDSHRITPLSGLTRVYYLLFAGNSGAYINNTAMQNIMNAFLSASGAGTSWLSTNKASGSLAPAQNETVNVTFDATGMDAGIYTTTLHMNSNDPLTPVRNVTATLSVSGAPDITLTKSTLDFHDVYVNGMKQLFFNIRNTGTDVLNVTSISVSNSVFSVGPLSMTINPRDSARVYVRFNPEEVGTKTANLRILSNDTDEGEVFVNLVGTGITAPVITLTPSNVQVGIVSGNRKFVKLRIRNTGGSRLDWSINNWNSPYWSVPDYTSGNIYPGNETDLTFTMDSKNIYPSTYSWSMWINTNDPTRQQIEVTFSVSITQNFPPYASNQLPDMQMSQFAEDEINLADYFSDVNLEPLKFYGVSDATSTASVSVTGSVLLVNANQIGTAVIYVTAEDGLGELAIQDFNVEVQTVTGLEDLAAVSRLECYPNPFEDKAHIKFNLKEQSVVDIRLLDVAGREYQLAKNQLMEAGNQEIEINPALSSGFYMCRLLVNGQAAGAIKIIRK